MKTPVSNTYKIVFVAVFTGCIMLLAVVFISTYIFNKTRGIMYLDYLTERYTLFNKKCEDLIISKEFIESCEKCVANNRYMPELKYKLKTIGYGSDVKVTITDRLGNIKLSKNKDLHMRSFLRIIAKNVREGEIYKSTYKIRTYTSDLVYTSVNNNIIINLFIERPIWERVFPKYRFDGVISGKNVIMMSREGFVSELNKFDPSKNKEILADYVINSKKVGDVTVYSLVYAPKNFILLLVGILIVVIFGSLWSAILIKISMKTVKKEANTREELIRRNYIAEIRELTASINPHFMYNTLEMIKYLAITEPQKARKVIEKFTKILRYSISNTEMEITLDEDLLYLEDYISIQKERFQDKFSCELNISDEAKRQKVMKLALQPIIENSIKYGFKKKSTLSIKIEGKVKGDYLVLTVTDNGGGMEEVALNKLRENMKNGEVVGGHNGIHNIARRLELKYKGKSGIKIENYENGFKTTMHIRQSKEEECTEY